MVRVTEFGTLKRKFAISLEDFSSGILTTRINCQHHFLAFFLRFCPRRLKPEKTAALMIRVCLKKTSAAHFLSSQKTSSFFNICLQKRTITIDIGFIGFSFVETVKYTML